MKWTSLVKLGLGILGAGGGFLIAKIIDQKKLNEQRAALEKSINISREQEVENSLLKEQNAHLIIETKKNIIKQILAAITDKDLKESIRMVGNLFIALLEKKYINKINLNEKESEFVALFNKMLLSENVERNQLEFAIEFAKQNLK